MPPIRKIKIWYRRFFAYREEYLLGKKWAKISQNRYNLIPYRRQQMRLF